MTDSLRGTDSNGVSLLPLPCFRQIRDLSKEYNLYIILYAQKKMLIPNNYAILLIAKSFKHSHARPLPLPANVNFFAAAPPSNSCSFCFFTMNQHTMSNLQSILVIKEIGPHVHFSSSSKCLAVNSKKIFQHCCHAIAVSFLRIIIVRSIVLVQCSFLAAKSTFVLKQYKLVA